jgi:hypothetical protein
MSIARRRIPPDKIAISVGSLVTKVYAMYRGSDKSLARPTSRCILFDSENTSFDVGLVIYILLIFLQL